MTQECLKEIEFLTDIRNNLAELIGRLEEKKAEMDILMPDGDIRDRFGNIKSWTF